MKRQRTYWLFHASYCAGTGIKVGWIHNKARGVKEDVIRLRILSRSAREPMEIAMRPDEAAVIAMGLSKAIIYGMFNGFITQQPKGFRK